MSIATEIQRLQQAKTVIAEAIVAKGGEVSGTIDTYASAIEALPSGGGEHGMIEGEVTLASASPTIKVACDLPTIPSFMIVSYMGDVSSVTTSNTTMSLVFPLPFDDTPTFAYIRGNKGSFGFVYNSAVVKLQKTECVASCYSNTYFLAGTYKYKICY